MKNQPVNSFSLQDLEPRRLMSTDGNVADDLLTTDANVLAVNAEITPTTPHIGISRHMKHQLHLKHLEHVKHTFFVKRQVRAAAREAAEQAREDFAKSTIPTAVLKAEGASPESETQTDTAE